MGVDLSILINVVILSLYIYVLNRFKEVGRYTFLAFIVVILSSWFVSYILEGLFALAQNLGPEKYSASLGLKRFDAITRHTLTTTYGLIVFTTVVKTNFRKYFLVLYVLLIKFVDLFYYIDNSLLTLAYFGFIIALFILVYRFAPFVFLNNKEDI